MATELPAAQQRLGKLLFDFGKHASGTAMDQYCELGMVAARELLSDPARWARELGIPPQPCPKCGELYHMLLCVQCGTVIAQIKPLDGPGDMKKAD